MNQKLEKRKRINLHNSELFSSSPEERYAIIQLIQSPGIGPARFFDLYTHYGSAHEALLNFKDATHKLKSVSLGDPRQVEQAEKSHKKLGARLVTFLEDAYPPLLREIACPPPVLSILGSVDVFQRNLLGVVGSRNASVNGRYFIKQLVEELSPFGISAISGFARGMDTAAHEASLSVGTVGVLAGGVDIVYPEENKALYAQVQERGCFVSEMPLGTHPQGRHFPRRNRLISGMASAVLVSEARAQSGSMLTAEYALDQGRDVMAIPGSPLDPRCSGSNSLLKQGASMVTRASDVLDLLGYDASPQKKSSPCGRKNNPVDEEALLTLLSAENVSRETLLEKLTVDADVFNALCTRLELEGKIICSPGGLVSLCLKTE